MRGVAPSLRRLERDDSGQALAEYGIALALGAALGWFENLAHVIGDQPPAVLLGGGLILVVLGWVVTRPPKVR